jgi:hypothetical protein
VDAVVVAGAWIYEGVRHDDRLFRFRIDAPDTEAHRAFFVSCKACLKKRFHQKDIWITASRIEVIE